LETFSRNTAAELANAGYEVTGLYGKSLDANSLREQMPRNEIVLWEGHHNTLVKEWGFTKWDEPMPPSLIMLQSCLALQPEKVHPLLARGAVGVIGTSTRTYSGSGGAFSLAYFDGLIYDGQTLGGSLRQAKNFLLAYAKLKQKRLGETEKAGANHRAAWAFALWGDPTFRLPLPQRSSSALPAVRHQVVGNKIVVEIPPTSHPEVVGDRYQIAIPPNARLAGLVHKNATAGKQSLVPFVFTEVALPQVPRDAKPRLKGSISANHWVFLWDARRRTGWLLVAPPPSVMNPMFSTAHTRRLTFSVEWSAAQVAAK
jgi:hypothetical protein